MEHIKSMDPYSHLTTFIAIIPAFALSRVLGGAADLIQHNMDGTPGSVRWSWLFVLVSTQFVTSIALTWWILFNWHDEPPYSFTLFFFFLLAPSIYIVIARLLMPDLEPDAHVDLEQHYFTVARWIFSLFALVVVLDIVDTLLHGADRFEEVGGAIYAAGNLLVAAVFVSLGFVRHRAYHWVALCCTQGYQIWLLFVAGIDSIG